jgi:magnesium transporter
MLPFVLRRGGFDPASASAPFVATLVDVCGVVTLRELFSAPADSEVSGVMRADLVSVGEETDQEVVGHLLAQHDLLAIPVVDAGSRMKGIVTHDDIVDVVQEEATEGIHRMGGTEVLDAPYLQTPLGEMFRKRVGWLAVLFLGQLLTAWVMGFYAAEMQKAVFLAWFIPLIVASGGNSGSQASTLVIRAMALGEVRLRDWWRVVRRELVAGLLLGSGLGVLGFLSVVAWQRALPGPDGAGPFGDDYVLVGVTVGSSILGVVTWGTLVGSMLPFVLRRGGFDPASASAPFVATLVDVCGVVIYFTLALVLLSRTLA